MQVTTTDSGGRIIFLYLPTPSWEIFRFIFERYFSFPEKSVGVMKSTSLPQSKGLSFEGVLPVITRPISLILYGFLTAVFICSSNLLIFLTYPHLLDSNRSPCYTPICRSNPTN